MLRFEDYLEERLKDEVLKYMLQNGYKSPNTLSPEFRAINDTYKQAYLSYNYGDSIAEKLRNNNATLYDGKFTKDTVNELLANEWNSKAGIETAKMVKTNPIDGLNPNQQILNTIGEHLVNNKLITAPNKARKLEEFDSVFQPVNNMKQNTPVLEGGIEKNVILTPPEKGKSKPVIEEYPEDMQPGDKVLKAGIEKNVSAYDLIQENKNLSTEEKVDKIHEVAEKRNQEIEKEHRKGMNKVYGKAAWDVGSNFIPAVGPFAKVANGISKVIAPLSKKAAPFVGKKIAQATTQGIAEGIATSPIEGIGDAIVEEQELLPTIGRKILTSPINALGKSALSSYLTKKIARRHLVHHTSQNKLPTYQQRELQDKATQYYEDYLEGRSVKLSDGSKAKFGSPNGIRIKPKNANIIPDLPDQLKSGKIINQGDKTSVHNKLNRKIYNYSINKNINGENTIGKINSVQGNKEEEQYFWLRELLKSLKSHI